MDLRAGFGTHGHTSVIHDPKKLTERLIEHAKTYKFHLESKLYCRDCSHFPIKPVVGPCGHSRCHSCVLAYPNCTCGLIAWYPLTPNTLVTKLLEKILITPENETNSHSANSQNSTGTASDVPTDAASNENLFANPVICPRPISNYPGQWGPSVHIPPQYYPNKRPVKELPEGHAHDDREERAERKKYNPYDRYNTSCNLATTGHWHAAVGHLAHVAATQIHVATYAKQLMENIVSLLNHPANNNLVNQLFTTTSNLNNTRNYIDQLDVQCPACRKRLVLPVTMPCGHSCCKTCMWRGTPLAIICAVCNKDFTFMQTLKEDEFLCAILGYNLCEEIRDNPQPIHLNETYITGIPRFNITPAMNEMNNESGVFNPLHVNHNHHVHLGGQGAFHRYQDHHGYVHQGSSVYHGGVYNPHQGSSVYHGGVYNPHQGSSVYHGGVYNPHQGSSVYHGGVYNPHQGSSVYHGGVYNPHQGSSVYHGGVYNPHQGSSVYHGGVYNHHQGSPVYHGGVYNPYQDGQDIFVPYQGSHHHVYVHQGSPVYHGDVYNPHQDGQGIFVPYQGNDYHGYSHQGSPVYHGDVYNPHQDGQGIFVPYQGNHYHGVDLNAFGGLHPYQAWQPH